MCTSFERRGKPAAQNIGPAHLYSVYGLTIESEPELPELAPAHRGRPDVQIRYGKVPETLDNLIATSSSRIASADEFIFNIEGLAKYHIARGEVITIDRRLDLKCAAPAADIRLWLLGTAFAALLHQRGLLPLHVSSAKTPNGVWAFTGDSGEGKSTLAGFLYRRFGYELVSDDVCAINPREDVPVIYPGPRRLKLWGDALDHLNFNGSKMVQDLSNTDKFQIYLNDEGEYRPDSLAALVVLESARNDATPTIERLHGIEALDAGFRAIYRGYMTQWFKEPEQPLMEIADLCRHTRIYRFRRPRCLVHFERNLEPLINLITRGGS